MKVFSYIKKYPVLSGVLGVFFLIIILFGVWIKYSRAVVPLGGMITAVFPCMCQAGMALTIGPPTPGVFLYQPGVTIPLPFYQFFRTGAWTLGAFAPGGSCSDFTDVCVPIPLEGTILFAGTSL